MNKGETIMIEKAANGYIVRSQLEPNTTYSVSSFMVFNDMGYASGARDNQSSEETLLGFIAAHFSERQP